MRKIRERGYIQMKMNRTISVLAAALLLLTGCADSSSVTTTEQTGTEPAGSVTAELTGTTANEAETDADSTRSTAPEQEMRTDAAQDATGTQASAGTQEISGGVQQSSTSAASVTTAGNGGRQQNAGSVTTASAPQEKSLVRDLTGVSMPGEVRAAFDAGSGSMAVCCGQGDGVLTAYVIDTASGKAVRSFRLTNSMEEPAGVTKQHELVTAECIMDDNGIQGTMLRFYDLSNGRSRQVSALCKDYLTVHCDPGSDTVLGIGRQVYAIGRDGSLRLLAESASSGRILLCENGVRLEEIEGADLYSDAAVYDQTGKNRRFTLKNPGSGYMNYSISADRIVVTSEFPSQSEQKTYMNAAVYNLSTGKEQSSFMLSDRYCSVYTSASTNIVLAEQTNPQTWTPEKIILLDAASGKCAKNELKYKSDACSARFCYLKDSGCWASAVTEGTSEKMSTRIFLIDPAQADFTGSLPAAKTAKNTGKQLGADLTPLLDITDRIRKDTGVTVQIGNEVYQAELPHNNRLISYEDSGKLTLDQYRNSLLTLEKQLKRYPEGFFRKYQHDGYGGLCILLPVSIENKSEGIAPGGLTWMGSRNYYVSVRAELNDRYSTSLHHEIWHSAENLLRNTGHAVDDAKWDACNPSGFSYTNSYEDYFLHPEYKKWNLKEAKEPVKHPDELHFTRDYGVVNRLEDRATVIEALFDTPWHFGIGDQCLGYKFSNTAEMIAAFPHLAGKVKVLGDAAKSLWGYVYWEKITK